MLGELDGRLRTAGLSDWLADLAQLRSLTERMDQPDFLPLRPQDLDMRTARQIRSLFPLVKRLAGEFGSSDPLVKGREKHSYDPRPYFGSWLIQGLRRRNLGWLVLRRMGHARLLAALGGRLRRRSLDDAGSGYGARPAATA